MSGAIVNGNISTGIFNFAFTIHSGSNNTIAVNIVDMGPSNNREILLYQGDGAAPMTGNSVHGNLIVSGGGGGWYEGKAFGAQPTISNNFYHHFAGAPVYTGGLGGLKGDASPVAADPQLSVLDVRFGWRQPGLSSAGIVQSAGAQLGAARLQGAEDRHAPVAAGGLLGEFPSRPVRAHGKCLRQEQVRPQPRNVCSNHWATRS